MAKRRGYSPTETQTRLKSQEAAVRLLRRLPGCSMVTAMTGGAAMAGLAGAEGNPGGVRQCIATGLASPRGRESATTRVR